MFAAEITIKPMSPLEDENFGSIWATLAQTVVGAAGTIYTAKTQEDIAESKLTHERTMIAMQEETKRMELAVQQKQADLLARASEKETMLGSISDPKTYAILGGAGLGIGLLVYLLLKK